jgi:predicted O-methyltransferase YrrM
MKHKNWFERIPGEKYIHPIPTNPGEIYGYCNFVDIYQNVINQATPDSTFVEIGTMAGLSTAWMTFFIAQSRKPINFYSIDPLPDVDGDDSFNLYGQEFDVSMYKLFIRNMKSLRLLSLVNHLRIKSIEAVGLFDDESVDFLFLDGDHSTEAVVADLEAWLPKMKKTSLVAGHDYDWKTVKDAVHQVLSGQEIISHGTSWMVNLKDPAANNIQISKLW